MGNSPSCEVRSIGLSCPRSVVGGHEYTMDNGSGRRRRRVHSVAFKAEAVAACRQPGMSNAAAALARALNANLLRRWVVETERAEEMTKSAVKALPAPTEAFVALPMPAKPTDKTPIRPMHILATFIRGRRRRPPFPILCRAASLPPSGSYRPRTQCALPAGIPYR